MFARHLPLSVGVCALLGAPFVVQGCDVPAAHLTGAWTFGVAADPEGRVATGDPIRIDVDRRLSPWSVGRSTVLLSSGPVRELVFPWFDPLRDQLVIELTRPMLPDTSYLVTIGRIEDLDGNVLMEPERLLLHTRPELTPLPPAEPVVPYHEVAGTLRTYCAAAGCHNEATRAAGLVLDTAQGISETALGRPSSQVGSATEVPVRARGLIDLPIIDAAATSRSTSQSYLIYKVIDDPHVIGESMPPPDAGALLLDDELARLAQWIRTGAALE